MASNYKQSVAIAGCKSKIISMHQAAKQIIGILRNVNLATIAEDLDVIHTNLCTEKAKYSSKYIKWLLEVLESLSCRKSIAEQALKTVMDYTEVPSSIQDAIQRRYMEQIRDCINNALIVPNDIIKFCETDTTTDACVHFPDAYISAIDTLVQSEADLISACCALNNDTFTVEIAMKVRLFQEFILDREQAIQDVTAFLKARNYRHVDFQTKFVPITDETKKKEDKQKMLAKEIDQLYKEAATATTEEDQLDYVMRLSGLNQQYHQLYF